MNSTVKNGLLASAVLVAFAVTNNAFARQNSEQTGLSAKLREIAIAKQVPLPTAPDADTQTLISEMQTASTSEFDKLYVQQSGVDSHKKPDQVMLTVESSATDSSLKDLAKAAHPLVKMHLKVAQAMMSSL